MAKQVYYALNTVYLKGCKCYNLVTKNNFFNTISANALKDYIAQGVVDIPNLTFVQNRYDEFGAVTIRKKKMRYTLDEEKKWYKDVLYDVVSNHGDYWSLLFDRLRLFVFCCTNNRSVDEEDIEKRDEDEIILNHMFEILEGFYIFLEDTKSNNPMKARKYVTNSNAIHKIYDEAMEVFKRELPSTYYRTIAYNWHSRSFASSICILRVIENLFGQLQCEIGDKSLVICLNVLEQILKQAEYTYFGRIMKNIYDNLFKEQIEKYAIKGETKHLRLVCIGDMQYEVIKKYILPETFEDFKKY